MHDWEPDGEIDDYNRYDVGWRCFPGPEDTEVKEMLYLVAYDISSARRLRKVAKTCERYGARIEKSVFECDLAPDRFRTLWEELLGLIRKEEDALVAYPIDRACAKRVESAGIVYRPPPRLWYFG